MIQKWSKIRNTLPKECFTLPKDFILDNKSLPTLTKYLRTSKEWLKYSALVLNNFLKVEVAQSCPIFCDPIDLVCGILQAGLLEWVAFPFSRGSSQPRDQNPGLPHCRWILYQLSHKGSTRVLEWVAYPFPSGSSRPRNRTRVSCIAGGFFTNWAIKGISPGNH